MQVSITVDVEHDCPPFLTTYRGIEQGVPRLPISDPVPPSFAVTSLQRQRSLPRWRPPRPAWAASICSSTAPV